MKERSVYVERVSSHSAGKTELATISISRIKTRDGVSTGQGESKVKNKSRRRGERLNNVSSRSLGWVPSAHYYESKAPDMSRIGPKPYKAR